MKTCGFGNLHIGYARLIFDLVRLTFRLEACCSTWKALTKSLLPYGSIMSTFWLRSSKYAQQRESHRIYPPKPNLLSGSIIGVRRQSVRKRLHLVLGIKAPKIRHPAYKSISRQWETVASGGALTQSRRSPYRFLLLRCRGAPENPVPPRHSWA